MNREAPSLIDMIIQQISLAPTKCLSDLSLCQRLLDIQILLRNQKHDSIEDTRLNSSYKRDIIQDMIQKIIDAGRMSDDTVPVLLYRGKIEVNLSNSKISGKYLYRVIQESTSSLVSLNVAGCFQIDDSRLIQCLRLCNPEIFSHLNIKNCRKITDQALVDIVNLNLPLKSLNIGGDFNITDNGLRNFLQNFKGASRLEGLHISGLSISDETVLFLIQKCKNIMSLGLGYLDLREATLLAVLQEYGPRLEKLDISWINTTPLAFNPQPPASLVAETIPTLCPNLVELDVTANRNLSLPHIQELIERKIIASQQQDNVLQRLTPVAKPLEILYIKFIATPKGNLESALDKVYPGLKIHF